MHSNAHRVPRHALRVDNLSQPASQIVLDDYVLACIGFDGDPGSRHDDPRRITVGLNTLDTSGAEVWVGATPVECGREQGVAFARNDSVLFGSLFLDDSATENLQRSTVRAYALIDSLLNRWGYPHWLRAWHFLARITEGEGEQERYRRFNAGRARAIELRGASAALLPAATAIGTHSRGLTIYFLAGKQPIVQVENPRQVSAFHYPEMYGRRSPSFSRAALHATATDTLLLVSGTASIVGHATVHAGNAGEQTREALRNIDALLSEAAKRTNGKSLHAMAQKVYVRHPSDWPAISAVLTDAGFAAKPLIALHADICRRDLLVEIEGVYATPTHGAPP